MAPALILASSSVYRRELLSRLLLPFTCVSPEIDERAHEGETPVSTAYRLAQEKAREVAKTNPQSLIIGSDQVADLNGKAIGKPMTHERAVLQLQSMSSQRVVFHTAVALYDARTDNMQVRNTISTVHFRELNAGLIERYLQAEKPYDCAGSAKVESLGIVLLEKIESEDPTALIGLPLIALVSMLKHLGIEVL